MEIYGLLEFLYHSHIRFIRYHLGSHVKYSLDYGFVDVSTKFEVFHLVLIEG